MSQGFDRRAKFRQFASRQLTRLPRNLALQFFERFRGVGLRVLLSLTQRVQPVLQGFQILLHLLAAGFELRQLRVLLLGLRGFLNLGSQFLERRDCRFLKHLGEVLHLALQLRRNELLFLGLTGQRLELLLELLRHRGVFLFLLLQLSEFFLQLVEHLLSFGIKLHLRRRRRSLWRQRIAGFRFLRIVLGLVFRRLLLGGVGRFLGFGLSGFDLLGERFEFLFELLQLLLHRFLFADQFHQLVAESVFLLLELGQLLVGRIRIIRQDADREVLRLRGLTFAIANLRAVLEDVARLQRFLQEVERDDRRIGAGDLRITLHRPTLKAGVLGLLSREHEFRQTEVIECRDHQRHLDRFAENKVNAGSLDHDLRRVVRHGDDAGFVHLMIGGSDFILQFDAIPAIGLDRKSAGPASSFVDRGVLRLRFEI